MCRVYWRVIAEIVYSSLLAAILNFCVKCKDVFISEMEQVRVILTKLLSHRDICRVYWRVFTEIFLSPLLAAILNFCVKCKYVFISEMKQVRVILTKLLSHRDICIVYWRVFTEIFLPLLLAVILNFFIKCKNVFILEMERARAILTKSLIHSASAVYLSLFAKILFPPLLAAILNFCIKCVYLGNEASQKFFHKIFDPQGTCIFDWCLLAKIVFPPLLAAILYFCIKHVYSGHRTS